MQFTSKFVRHALATAALCAVASASQAQSWPYNASFESPNCDSSGTFCSWWATNPASFVTGGAADGNRYALLGADGALTQSSTVGSGLYTIDFWAFGSGKSVLFDSAAISSGSFTAVDITEGLDPLNYAVVTTQGYLGHNAERFLIDSGSNNSWQHYSYTFNAQAGTGYHLYFVGIGSQFAVDNVSVMPTAVPEPEAYAMLIAGLGALGLAAKRRSRRNESAATSAV
jgi:hypothetical protein